MLKTANNRPVKTCKRHQFLFTPSVADGIGIGAAITVCHAGTPAPVTDGIIRISIGNASAPTSPPVADGIGIAAAITVCHAGTPAPLTNEVSVGADIRVRHRASAA